MSYEVQLEVFEGPLDLLLYLIERNEVSITDIPISLITKQYLETIQIMESLDLEVAGEYLVMAAYLVHIKSQMLLPSPEEEEKPETRDDPRAELVEHLLEYKRYKEAAKKLASVNMLDREVFTRPEREDYEYLSKSVQPVQVDIHELLTAFRGILRRLSRKEPIELQPDLLLVEDKINEILNQLRYHRWITFLSLFDDNSSRLNIITTLLALLEIVKLRVVRIYQDSPFGTILISKQTDSNAGTQATSTLHGSGSA